MAGGIVGALRRGSREQRKAAAILIGRTDDNDVIDELIRMVEGECRLSWIWPFGRYDFEDQLTGIEALGKSGNGRAHDYLWDVYKMREEHTEFVRDRTADTPAIVRVIYEFPEAKGGLADDLKYSEVNGKREQEISRAHRAISAAIQELEVSTGRGKVRIGQNL